ncbi:MAG: hypothetical protein LIO80_02575 [Lachnospiraceae bacterium]|nr:hypothetical protein [Lachnospiraceae bacterium]
MDFGQEYYRMFRGQAGEKIPFYMTYPMRNSFLDEAEYERDCRRLQELYPRDARRIQGLVERECDRMEHEGSMMFDEYPDRLLFRMLCRNIYRVLQDVEEEQAVMPDRDHPLMQLIEVMLTQEMYRRRCRYRRCRHRY